MDKNIKERWEAIDQGLVPKGYKKTKVGIIPEDWDVKKLGEVAEVTMGQSPDSKTYNKKGIGLPLIQGNSDIRDRRTSPRLYTSEPIKTCNFGDTIMAVRAPVGTVAKSYHKACIGRGVCSIRSINNNYMYYYLLNYEKNWIRLAQGSTFMAINSFDISNSKIPSPPLEEQERIADILSTWDRAIESYGKLLEEKKERKKGLMQLLLTGEKRLGGFIGPWKEVRLGDIFSIPNKKEVIDPEINKIITVRLHRKGVFTGLQNETLSLGATKYYYRRSGQFIYGKQNIFNGAFGLVPKELDMCYSSADIPSLDFKDGLVVPKYIDYYFSRKSIYGRLESRAIGTGSKRLHESEFLKIEIILPSLEEQKAIAEVLATADEEIDLLEKLIEELEEEKKGLMQLLLKGIVRV